jgi:predicted enzyme related to lactoylglutathione lyase
MSHPVVWFEVMGDDGPLLRNFYAKLFGWKIQTDGASDYGLVEAEAGRGIAGGIGQLGEVPHPKVTFYVATSDVEKSLLRAVELGGSVLMPRTQIPQGPVIGQFADPEGNFIGLVEETD